MKIKIKKQISDFTSEQRKEVEKLEDHDTQEDMGSLTYEELVDKKLLTFEPKIDGEIYWSDKRLFEKRTHLK